MVPDSQEALALYGLDNATAKLLRHNENLTYRVDCGEHAYCLRLKAPISGFDLSAFDADSDGDQESLLRGELNLLNALCEQTDIPVQQPVRTVSGEFVARLSDGTLASLLCWMDGTPFDTGMRTPQMLVSAGQTLARLRNAVEAIPSLNTHRRLSYHQKLTERLAARVEMGTDYLQADAIHSITSALRAVASVMDNMDAIEAPLLSHADPSFGNMIWTNGRVGLIDWSLSGYAHSLMDLGGLMGVTSDTEEQRLLLQGWEGVRGSINRRHVDAYFALSVLLFVSCQYTRANEWTEWFPSALERWQTTVFDPFSSGHPIPCIL